MKVTRSVRWLTGWALVLLGSGVLCGDFGARLLGWNGPTTLQVVAATLTWSGAFAVIFDRRSSDPLEEP